MLSRHLSEEELADCMGSAPNGRDIALPEFAAWWNSERCNPQLAELRRTKMAVGTQIEGSGALFG